MYSMTLLGLPRWYQLKKNPPPANVVAAHIRL